MVFLWFSYGFPMVFQRNHIATRHGPAASLAAWSSRRLSFLPSPSASVHLAASCHLVSQEWNQKGNRFGYNICIYIYLYTHISGYCLVYLTLSGYIRISMELLVDIISECSIWLLGGIGNTPFTLETQAGMGASN